MLPVHWLSPASLSDARVGEVQLVESPALDFHERPNATSWQRTSRARWITPAQLSKKERNLLASEADQPLVSLSLCSPTA